MSTTRSSTIPAGGGAVLLAVALVAAACGGGGDDSSDERPSLATTIPTIVTTTTVADAGTTTAPVTAGGTDVSDLVARAAADGTVTADEITGILEAAEVPPTEAACQAEILAEVGVTDPTDPQQLAEASASMTPDQVARLGACITGGG